MRAVPIIPFVHTNTDILSFQSGYIFPVSPVRFGYPANITGNLQYVRHQSSTMPVLTIKMFAHQIHPLGTISQNHFVPPAHFSDSDQVDRRIYFPHRICKTVMFFHKSLRTHKTELPIPEHFIPDGPPFHLPGFCLSVLFPPFTHRSILCTVTIFHLIGSFFYPSQTGIYSNIRLGIQQFTQSHKLMNPDIVRFHSCPGRISPGRPFIPFTDPVMPIITTDEITSRPTIYRSFQSSQQSQHIRPEAVDMIIRHQRSRTDP